MDVTTLTLSEAARLIAARQLSPLELTRACLERIARLEPRLVAFITVTADLALRQAQDAETAMQRSELRGPLHGIPIALKDLYETGGIRTTAGSSFLRDYVPEADCVAAQKLNAAGVVLLGKLNMNEWALGLTGDNVHYGSACNPWKLSHIPGGSSSGSAAALAATLCLGSLGSDTGGSIRIPASLCGIVGLKPTYGRVSLRGVIPLSSNLDHAGPMARCVRDVALLLQAIAGYDPGDPFSANVPTDDYLTMLDQGVRGWRVALVQGEFVSTADAEVLQAVYDAATVFEQLGAHITEVDLNWARDTHRLNRLMLAADAKAIHRERVQSNPQGFSAEVLARIQEADQFTAEDYALARRAQSFFRHRFAGFFVDYDILLLPTTPMPAPPRSDPEAMNKARSSMSFYTRAFNFAGVPALSVPCGFTRDGLPVGLQIVGPHWSEASVLRAGYAYEQATAWHKRQPPLTA